MNTASKFHTFANVEKWKRGENYDAVIASVSSSNGSLAPSHAHSGPDLIRRVSAALAREYKGKQHGWVDLVTGERFCSDIRIADAGEIANEFEPIPRPSADISRRIEKIRQSTRLLVMLIGDDSWTYEVMFSQTGKLLHLDAHIDKNPRYPDVLNHANHIERLLQDNHEIIVGHWGRRGIVPDEGDNIQRNSRYHILKDIKDVNIFFKMSDIIQKHIALDIDIVNPNEIMSVTCPMPGGPSLNTLEQLICSVGSFKTLSIAEFAPTSRFPTSATEAFALCEFILKAIDAGLKTSR